MEKVSKKDFEILFYIEFGAFNDPKGLSSKLGISEKEAEEKIKEFEKRELITMEYREGKIYGSQLTEKGKQIWNNKKYLNWKVEGGY